MEKVQLILAAVCVLIPWHPSNGALVDPATVTCGESEYPWCDFDNGLVRGGSAPRKCAGQCICEGHPSFHGDNLDWIDGKCVTPIGHVCGKSVDGSMEIFCASGMECISGRCREPNFTKHPAGGRCRDDVECQEGLKCRAHFVQSPPLLPYPNNRFERAIGPQYCCSAREEEYDNTQYTMSTLPCN